MSSSSRHGDLLPIWNVNEIRFVISTSNTYEVYMVHKFWCSFHRAEREIPLRRSYRISPWDIAGKKCLENVFAKVRGENIKYISDSLLPNYLEKGNGHNENNSHSRTNFWGASLTIAHPLLVLDRALGTNFWLNEYRVRWMPRSRPRT